MREKATLRSWYRSRWLLLLAVVVTPFVHAKVYGLSVDETQPVDMKDTKHESEFAVLHPLTAADPGKTWQGSYTPSGCKNSVGDPCGTTYSRGPGGGLFKD